MRFILSSPYIAQVQCLVSLIHYALQQTSWLTWLAARKGTILNSLSRPRIQLVLCWVRLFGDREVTDSCAIVGQLLNHVMFFAHSHCMLFCSLLSHVSVVWGMLTLFDYKISVPTHLDD